MDHQPQTWHHGLLARWWAEFNRISPEELGFFRGLIEREGQPALDMGCGAGRLLVPLLEAGLDVDGSDLSADMLAFSRANAKKAGYEPNLYHQTMHQLDVPRAYHTILICDSFAIGGYREQDQEALRRIYCHLEPGGVLAFNVEMPYADAKQWQLWLAEPRRALPHAWPEQGGRRQTADGDEIEFIVRLVDLDPLEQRVTLQSRLRLWRNGQQVGAEEEYPLQISLYFRNELLLMLEKAGFQDVVVQGGYSGNPPAADDGFLMFIARKGLSG